jgi:short-subunit dehydrogenase
MASTKSPAIVADASTGIGYELAKLCAENGFDLVVAADETEIHAAAERLQSLGASVEAVSRQLREWINSTAFLPG